MRAQSGNGVAAEEAAPGTGRPSVHSRPVLAPPTWESTVRTAPQLFPRTPAAVPNRLRVFSGTSNPALSQEVACYLGLDLGGIKIKRFADGEIYVQVRGGRDERGAGADGGSWEAGADHFGHERRATGCCTALPPAPI